MRTTVGNAFRLLNLMAVSVAVFTCSAAQGLISLVPGPQSSGPPSQSAARTVTGTVVNALTGEPIRHALVQMQGQSIASALTGPDGRFRFEDAHEGQVFLNAQKPGFFDSRSVPRGPWQTAENSSFTVGSGANDFQIKLYPAARIGGHINDGNGEPIENVPLQVMVEQIFQGRKQWQNQGGSSSDDDGAFRIDNLTPGRYVIFSGAHTTPGQEVTRPLFYPNAPEITSAQTIDLQAGQEFLADFQLRSERGYRVVVQTGGSPSDVGIQASFETSSGQNVQFPYRISQKQGQFLFQAVPPGTWTLVLQGGDRHGNQYEARQEINVDHADITNLQIILHPSASIPLVVNRSAAPQTEQQPQAIVEPMAGNLAGRPLIHPNLQASLIHAEPNRQNTYYAGFSGADPPVFGFHGIPPGRYKLDVQTFGNECVESATYGGTDLSRDYLIVGSDSTTQPITINMRSDCPTLSVTANAGEKNAGMAHIILVPASSFAQPKVQQIYVPPAESGGSQAGVSQFTLSPGSYQVFAFSNIDGLEYANPEALRSYPSQSVTLDAGQKAEITIDLVERKAN